MVSGYGRVKCMTSNCADAGRSLTKRGVAAMVKVEITDNEVSRAAFASAFLFVDSFKQLKPKTQESRKTLIYED